MARSALSAPVSRSRTPAQNNLSRTLQARGKAILSAAEDDVEDEPEASISRASTPRASLRRATAASLTAVARTSSVRSSASRGRRSQCGAVDTDGEADASGSDYLPTEAQDAPRRSFRGSPLLFAASATPSAAAAWQQRKGARKGECDEIEEYESALPSNAQLQSQMEAPRKRMRITIGSDAAHGSSRNSAPVTKPTSRRASGRAFRIESSDEDTERRGFASDSAVSARNQGRRTTDRPQPRRSAAEASLAATKNAYKDPFPNARKDKGKSKARDQASSSWAAEKTRRKRRHVHTAAVVDEDAEVEKEKGRRRKKGDAEDQLPADTAAAVKEEEAGSEAERQIEAEEELFAQWAQEYYEVIEQLPLELSRSFALMRELEDESMAQQGLLARQILAYRDERNKLRTWLRQQFGLLEQGAGTIGDLTPKALNGVPQQGQGDAHDGLGLKTVEEGVQPSAQSDQVAATSKALESTEPVDKLLLNVTTETAAVQSSSHARDKSIDNVAAAGLVASASLSASTALVGTKNAGYAGQGANRAGDQVAAAGANRDDNADLNADADGEADAEGEEGLTSTIDMAGEASASHGKSEQSPNLHDAGKDNDRSKDSFQVVDVSMCGGEDGSQAGLRPQQPSPPRLDPATNDKAVAAAAAAAPAAAPSMIANRSSAFTPEVSKRRRQKQLASILSLSSAMISAAEEKCGLATTMYDWIDRHVQTLDLELQKSESELGGISVRRGTSWSGALREAQGLDAGKGGAGGTGGAGRKRKGASTGLDGDVSASAGTSNAPKKLKGTMATLSRKASSKKKWRVAELMEEASLEGPPPTLNGLGSVAAAMAAAQRLEGEPTYCYCDSISFGAMIQCDNSDSCPIEWFHWPCIGLQTEPKSKWYCAYCRPKGWKGPGMDVPPMAPKAPP